MGINYHNNKHSKNLKKGFLSKTRTKRGKIIIARKRLKGRNLNVIFSKIKRKIQNHLKQGSAKKVRKNSNV